LLLSLIGGAAAPPVAHGQWVRQPPPAPCATQDYPAAPLSVSYEGRDDKAWAGDRYVEGVLLRLTNTSDCAVYLKVADGEARRFKVEGGKLARMEVGEARDGQRISLEYVIKHHDADDLFSRGVGGHVLEPARLDKGRSVLFSIPLDDFRTASEVRVPFKFDREVLTDAPAEGQGGGAVPGKAEERYVSFEPWRLSASLSK
jgi:hypothetical protein